MRKILFIFFLVATSMSFAQELNATVTVVAQQTGNDNNVVFQTLERQLKEFINNTQWTDNDFKVQERINCSFLINVQNYSNDAFLQHCKCKHQDLFLDQPTAHRSTLLMTGIFSLTISSFKI